MTDWLYDTYQGKTVLVTGHTGFKGAWLCFWLSELGARVHGLALPPIDPPSCYDDLELTEVVNSRFLDVRGPGEVEATLKNINPEIVFHLAAQPLVREGWEKPRETFDVNVMGTVNVVDAAVRLPSVKAVVVVTTDKCYENTGGGVPLRETDPLGGHDPYSASKAAAELVVRPYRQLELLGIDHAVHIATARGGNVIGGGDRGRDRLLPDLVRAIESGSNVTLRRPDDVRPWQHVFDCLGGYLVLGHHLFRGTAGAPAYNFGPGEPMAPSVLEVARFFLEEWGPSSTTIRIDRDDSRRELPELRLDTDLARKHLGWEAAWGWKRAIRESVAFYRAARDRKSALAKSQLTSYLQDALPAWRLSAP